MSFSKSNAVTKIRKFFKENKSAGNLKTKNKWDGSSVDPHAKPLNTYKSPLKLYSRRICAAVSRPKLYIVYNIEHRKESNVVLGLYNIAQLSYTHLTSIL
jgi:hypothetical protein